MNNLVMWWKTKDASGGLRHRKSQAWTLAAFKAWSFGRQKTQAGGFDSRKTQAGTLAALKGTLAALKGTLAALRGRKRGRLLH